MHNNKAKQTQTQLGDYILNFVKKDKELVLTYHIFIYVLYDISQIRLLSKYTKYLALSMRIQRSVMLHIVLGSILCCGLEADRCANSPSPGPGGLLQEEEENQHGDQA